MSVVLGFVGFYPDKTIQSCLAQNKILGIYFKSPAWVMIVSNWLCLLIAVKYYGLFLRDELR